VACGFFETILLLAFIVLRWPKI